MERKTQEGQMIKVTVVNRGTAELMSLSENFACISIFTPGDTPAEIQSLEGYTLPLEFSDISDPRLIERIMKSHGDVAPLMKLITPDHARQILDFVDRHIKNGVEHFVVHCDAGISRSPGVAVALKEIYNNDREIKPEHRLYNRLVYSTIIKVYHEERHGEEKIGTMGTGEKKDKGEGQ